MKYLKKYNESKEDNFKEYVQKFCEDHLAELIDIGFKIGIKLVGYDIWEIKIVKDNKKFGGVFTWENVRDNFIPFFYMLSEEFVVLELPIGGRRTTPSRILVSGNFIYDTSKRGNTGKEVVEFENQHKSYYYTKEEVLDDKCKESSSLYAITINIIRG